MANEYGVETINTFGYQKRGVFVAIGVGCALLFDNTAYATEYGATPNAPNASNVRTGTSTGFNLSFNGDTGSLSATVEMLLILTVIALAPSILVMLTSFTRIIVVLHFTRAALGTQTSPPNQVMIGLALFLTLFIMWPTFSTINTEAIQPFDQGQMFCDIANVQYDDYDDVPFSVLVPSFIISELRTAFIIGFLIYIPFIVIDMVISSVLMSMGMMMLPPTTISMPFKILLFVLADGWNLVIGNLVKTFY